MKSRILGLMALGLLASPVVADATTLSGTWTFTATVGTNTYGGSFSLSGLDTTLDYINSTGAGFSVTTDFDTSWMGTVANVFTYTASARRLTVGGLLGTAGSAYSGAEVLWIYPSNDWYLSFVLPDLSNRMFGYMPVGGGGTVQVFTVNVVQSVPEPATLALLGVGLAGLGVSRRRRAS